MLVDTLPYSGRNPLIGERDDNDDYITVRGIVGTHPMRSSRRALCARREVGSRAHVAAPVVAARIPRSLLALGRLHLAQPIAVAVAAACCSEG